MRRLTVPFVLVFCMASALFTVASAWIPVDSVSVERVWFYDDGDSLALAYATSHDLHQQHPSITRAIINIHGASRESEEAFDRVIVGGNDHDREVWSHTAVICPQFLFTIDIDSHDCVDSLLYWNTFPEIGPSWCYGEVSKNNNNFPRPFRVTSYTCLDSIAHHVLGAFPNLENLVFAGHSAGARMMQRYAIVTKLDLDYEGPRILYNYGNPAVYAYVGPERHVGENWDEFEVPSGAVIDECPEYDDWPFGLQEPFEYFDDIPMEEMIESYSGRHVIQWLSELDTTALEGGSQVSCQAMLSGDQHRLQRGLIFYNHVLFTYGEEPQRFVQAIVPDLGHQGNAVYRSEVGRYYLFDYYDRLSPGEEMELEGELTVPNPETVEGLIDFGIHVQSPSEEVRTGHIWMQLISQNGGVRADGWQWDVVFEPELDFVRESMDFYVPHGFPLGQATLYLNMGTYPDAIIEWDSVPVLVTSTTSAGDGNVELPQALPSIKTIAPNPFNASTNVLISIPHPTVLRLKLYDVLGREVMTIASGPVPVGMQTFTVQGQQLAGGIYFLRASAPHGYEEIRKVVLIQ